MPSMASLVVSETIANAKDGGKPLYVATLDACKTFNVVVQNSLLNKFYNTGFKNNLWLLKRDSYKDLTSMVKFRNQLTQEFKILQGVRQG